MATAKSLLDELEKLKTEYGGGSGARKLELLRILARRRLSAARDVLRLHEVLCFLKAYPDGPELLKQVEAMLARFGRRADLRRHRRALENTGVAGTVTEYPFYWVTARWLARKWPDLLTVNWAEFDKKGEIEELLPLLFPYWTSSAFDELAMTPRGWIHRLKGADETDAAFLIRRFEAVRADSFNVEKMYEDLDVPIRLEPGPGTPSRSRERHRGSPVRFQTRPLVRGRPALAREIRRRPAAVRWADRREGREVVDLARSLMVARQRDLDLFEYGNPDDVRFVDWGGGLSFAFIGAVPERRLMLESVHGAITLKNGVPLGYCTASALFGSAEVAFNLFDTFRGGESALLFCRLLATVRHLFGCDAFTLDPFQLGYGNAEGLKSGAWWFYQKMGFRPLEPETKALMERELKRMKRSSRHRSDLATLNRLASENAFFFLGRVRGDVLGRLTLGNAAMAATRRLTAVFGADLERAERECSRGAAGLLGLRSLRGFSPGERLAWRRWSPLVTALPGLRRWGSAARKELVRVIRAKGGRRESDFVALFDRHKLLRRAILRLAREE